MKSAEMEKKIAKVFQDLDKAGKGKIGRPYEIEMDKALSKLGAIQDALLEQCQVGSMGFQDWTEKDFHTCGRMLKTFSEAREKLLSDENYDRAEANGNT